MLNARPRLIDFELARPTAEAARLTEPGGTWAYMPPEQRRAGLADRPAAVGPPADVFALAASLHEALAGGQLAHPSLAQAATLPGPVGELLGHALAPTPDDRPTAAELSGALAESADRPVMAQVAGTGMAAATTVPPPGGLSTRSSPFIAATRS